MAISIRAIASSIIVASVLFSASPPAGAQTQNMEQRQNARDTRQTGRAETSAAKQACRKGDEKTNAQCRKEKRSTKQDVRQQARDTRQQ